MIDLIAKGSNVVDSNTKMPRFTAGRRHLLTACATAALGTRDARASDCTQAPATGCDRGIPGARNFDHAGLVVRDLEEAIRFMVDVLGADLLFQWPATGGLESKEDAAPGTTVAGAFLRFGPNTNLELLQFQRPNRITAPPPRVSDDHAVHFAVWVEDIKAAVDYLRAQPGVEIIGDVGAPSQGADKGTTWVYARTPFGLHIELVNRPLMMPYEGQTTARFYGPAPSWR